MQEADTPVVGALDHRLLNEITGLGNPTCEAIVAWIWDKLAPALPGLTELRLHETHDTRAIYNGPQEAGRGNGPQ